MSETAATQAVVQRLRAAGCVFAEDEARLLREQFAGAELEHAVRRRCAGEPLEHLLGWAEFDGLRVAVRPGVFVPRRRTELLARVAARLLQSGDIVLDMCCGAGAVAAALGRRVAGLQMVAADSDPAAAACAERNLPGATVVTGDLFAPVPDALRGRVAVITANAPYVPTDAIALMPPEARDHEARAALDGGPDGLDVHRRIAAAAPDWLVPGGALVVECSNAQQRAHVELLRHNGFVVAEHSDDDSGAVILAGRLP